MAGTKQAEQITELPAADTFPPTVELVSGPDRVELSGSQLHALMSPINPARVASRNVGGTSLSYVEAWDIKATLIRIFGFGGFSVECIDSKIIDIRDGGRQGHYPQTHSKAGQEKTPYVMAQATVRLTIHGIGPGGRDVVYTEAAIGTNDGWTIGDVADNAIKSAASDALKRCAIFLGTQFGLSLYNNGDRKDVVRILMEPEQAALLDSYRAGLNESKPTPEFDETAEANFARALGAVRVGETGVGQIEEGVTQRHTDEPLPSSGVPVADKIVAGLTGEQVGEQTPSDEDGIA